jgi:branched-chain amino acid aminotransferase
VAIFVSIDGVIVPPERATISVFDRGLLYGDGCFEVLRTWNGKAVALPAHLDRLAATARFLQLQTPTRDQLVAWVEDAVTAAAQGERRIRIVITRGPGALGARLAELGRGSCIVIVEPLGEQPTELSLAVVDWPVARRPGTGHKTLAYLDHIVARELARAAGADEAIRLDDRGFVVEGGTCNVFAVQGGRVLTPATDGGVLPGIVRATVLELAGALRIPTEVRELSLAELRGADEWFVTSSLRGVVGVTRLDGKQRSVGPVTKSLAAAYRRAFGM